MARVVKDPGMAQRFGAAGRQRVRQCFSRDAFARSLEATCSDLVRKPPRPSWRPLLLLLAFVLVYVLLPCVAAGLALRWLAVRA
jgi:hypothetical protein